MIPAVVLDTLWRRRRVIAWAALVAVAVGCGVGYCRQRDAGIRDAATRATEARLAPVLVRARMQAADALWSQRTAERALADSLAAHAARSTPVFHGQRAHTDSALAALSLTPLPAVAGDTVAYVGLERRGDPKVYPVPRFVAGLLLAQKATIDTAAAIIARQHAALARMDAVAQLDSATLALKDSAIVDLTRQLVAPKPAPKGRGWMKWAGGAVAVAATVVLVR